MLFFVGPPYLAWLLVVGSGDAKSKIRLTDPQVAAGLGVVSAQWGAGGVAVEGGDDAPRPGCRLLPRRLLRPIHSRPPCLQGLRVSRRHARQARHSVRGRGGRGGKRFVRLQQQGVHQDPRSNYLIPGPPLVTELAARFSGAKLSPQYLVSKIS